MINKNAKKLTQIDVDKIRKSYDDVAVLAKRYNVSYVTIYAIVNYKTWKLKEPMTAQEKYIVKLEAEVKRLKGLLNG